MFNLKTIRCPSCSEIIFSDIKKCNYCNNWIPVKVPTIDDKKKAFRRREPTYDDIIMTKMFVGFLIFCAWTTLITLLPIIGVFSSLIFLIIIFLYRQAPKSLPKFLLDQSKKYITGSISTFFYSSLFLSSFLLSFGMISAYENNSREKNINDLSSNNIEYKNTSNLYDLNSAAYQLAVIDKGRDLTEDEYSYYSLNQRLLSEITTSFKPETRANADIKNMTLNIQKRLREKGEDLSLQQILLLTDSKDKSVYQLTTYSEYMALIITMTNPKK